MLNFSNIFKEKCWLCNEKDRKRNMISIYRYGIYSSHYYFYHQKCLDLICDTPEEYTHNQVDRALSLIEMIEEDKQRKIAQQIAYKKNCEKLKDKCS